MAVALLGSQLLLQLVQLQNASPVVAQEVQLLSNQ